jgi:VWFA-related protein
MLMRFALVVGLTAATVTAQDQPTIPTFRTEANYVRVDVYPTLNGAPVPDLAKDDFEVLDDRRPQTIAQFERVALAGTNATTERTDPRTIDESREALQNPRARVFIVFLDTNQVERSGAYRVRQPLIDALNRLIAPDDLFAVMTPQMTPDMLTFVRKTTAFANELNRHWDWGRRDNPMAKDDWEHTCEANNPDKAALVEEAIARRRERQTLTGLADLQTFLRTVREERKAIVTVTNGWVLFRPNPALNVLRGTCGHETAAIDDAAAFRELADRANRANVSFYPIDPRGLAVFDASITRPLTPGPGPQIAGFNNALDPEVDRAQFQARRTSLQTIAAETDGLAMFNSNDLGAEFRKIVNDLSSYYLLGYYSTAKLDGRFHSISVHVKRRGVDVRARRGYLAATPDPVTASVARTGRGDAPGTIDREAVAVAAAMAPLSNFAREVPLRVQAAVGWRTTDPPTPFVVVEGELSATREFEELTKTGAVATVELTPTDGPSLATARTTLSPGVRAFRLTLLPSSPLPPGDYVIRMTARAADATVPMRETVQIHVAPGLVPSGALSFRRGQSTGNRDTPTADPRFRRNEQVRVEVPATTGAAGSARLLDRAGKPLPIPVATTMRADADGSRWQTAQLALASLAPGDYMIEMSDGDDRALAAFRVVP